MRIDRCLLPALLLSAAVAAAAPTYVWVEAEGARDKLQQANDWYDPVDRQTSLSGGDWWHSFDEIGMRSGYAVCEFAVPAAATYRLWIRLNTSATGYRWGLDGAAPAELPLKQWQDEQKEHAQDLAYDRRLFDETYAAHDGSNRHKLTWVKGPELELAAGPHRLRFEVQPNAEGKGFAAVDCFVLAAPGFTFRPRMSCKPEETVATEPELDPARAWPAVFAHDAFAPTPIDLRGLNERVAGEHGFVRLAADGEGFLRGDGEPLRFWSGSEYAWRIPFADKNLLVSEPEAAAVAHKARWLAKRGINMVRFHGHLPPGDGSTRDDINLVDLHGAWYLVAAFKKEGVYSTLSPYWGSHTDNQKSWNLGFDGGTLAGLVFFYEPVQQMYKGWLRRLFTEPNPYTGIALKDDPALAIIQLQNEDSLLFYTEAKITGEPRQVLCRKFGDFLKRKHGSLEKAFARYTSRYESDWDLRGADSVEQGTAGLLQPWFLTLDAKERAGRWDAQTRARLDDQLEFYTLLMRDFNAAITRYLRDELGCRQLINAGNWKAADAVVGTDAERYSYTANEVIGRNAYYSSLHNGINVGWQILPQQVYANWSALKRPAFWPMNVKQVAGYPFIIPESLWVPPNLYLSEGPLVVAGQLSLTGVDSFYWFASGGEEWAALDSKWPFNTVMQLGQFPATALAFRKGYIAEARAPVVYEERSLQDIWQQKLPLIAESPVFDPNRDAGDMPVESRVRTPVDPLAFCVGPVRVKYGGSAANNRVAPELAGLIDPAAQTLRSVTGEIATDYGRGLYTVDAPRCQGAAGFLSARPEITLRDVRIACSNDYATIVVVPLDDQPIATSRQLLVQVGTVARPRGWVARRRAIEADGATHDGLQILRKGGEPLMVANTDARVTIRNPGLARAAALDLNGQPQGGAIPLSRTADGVSLRLPPDALYTVLRAE